MHKAESVEKERSLLDACAEMRNCGRPKPGRRVEGMMANRHGVVEWRYKREKREITTAPSGAGSQWGDFARRSGEQGGAGLATNLT